MVRNTWSRYVTGAFAAAAVLAFAVVAAAQTGTVRGSVVDAQGKPVEGAKVTIIQKGAKAGGRELTTNKKGEFIQLGVFPATYLVSAVKDDLKAPPVEMPIGLGDNPPIDLHLSAAGPSAEEKARVATLQKSFDDGVAASKAGNYDESIAKFNEAIAVAPNCQDCYYNIGFANAKKKEWAAAETALKKAVEIKPDYSDAWSLLAAVYNQENKTDLALEASAKAGPTAGPAGGAASAGGNAGALYNQGVILWNAQKFPEAKEKFDAATKADPTNADAFYRLGMADVNLGDMPGAVAAFEGYLKAAPDGPHAAEVKGFIAAMKK